MRGHSEHRRSLPSTCMDALMPRRHGCLGTAMALRYNVHPEHKKGFGPFFISFRYKNLIIILVINRQIHYNHAQFHKRV